ncbi:hypothetical protein [Patulibacter defluvii]|uniref:hypothetical protein n=1 Tax=Patulibacter defluvii TaxID=3095358 RepID=UPI002A75B51B|nr:hypothetical protein [Patulibacter sp. DM4]
MPTPVPRPPRPAAPRRVAIVGTGRAGREIVRACALAPDVALAAAVVHDRGKLGRDLAQIAGLDAATGVLATDDLDAVLADPAIDVVLHSGLGDPAAVAAVLGRCADHGKDAVTVSGLVHPGRALGEDGAAALAARAIAGGARLVGTGVNPGFVLDALPVMWGSMVAAPTAVHAQRVSEIRSWGRGILSEIGLGRPVDEVVDVSPLSVAESLAVVVDGLGLAVDEIAETVAPIPAIGRRSHGDLVVEAGRSAGFRRIASAVRDGHAVASIEWIALFCIAPEDGVEERARLRIVGETEVEADARGTFFGDPYPSTAARAVHAAIALRDLPPGLYRPDQLPVGRGGRAR